MANVTFDQSFNSLADQDWEWAFDQSYGAAHLTSVSTVGNGTYYTFSSIKITDGIHTQYMNGSITVYVEIVSETQTITTTSGTVTSTSYWMDGEQIYSADSFSLSAAKLATFANTFGDTQATYAYMFSLSDLMNGSAYEDTIVGYAGNDTIYGNSGNDSLDGGAGGDSLVGGIGNDAYVIDNVSDVITETSTLATEIDTVYSSVTWTLGANLEKLTLTGSSAINGTGNSLANSLIGNSVANVLNSGAGNDSLVGGLGADSLVGGTGNDTYVVDNVSDVIAETSTLATEIDTVNSSVTWTLGANLEKLTLTGSSAINGTGNSLANSLIGNSVANVLNSGAGNDSLVGGGGEDTLKGGAGNDTISGGGNMGSPQDSGGNEIYGEDGDDVLYGWNVSDGNASTPVPDKLWGGEDVDKFYVDTTPNASDQIMDFAIGEFAYSATFADVRRYVIYSSDQGSKVNFFDGDGGPKVAGFEFNTRILPQNLIIGAAGNLLSVEQELTAAGTFALINKTVEAFSPVIDATVTHIVGAIKDYAVGKSFDFMVKKAMPLILDKFISSDIAFNAVTSVLQKFSDVFDRKFTQTEFDQLGHAVISEWAKAITGKVIGELYKSSSGASAGNDYYDFYKAITSPLQVISPAFNGWIKFGDAAQQTIGAAIDVYFAAETTNMLLSLPDVTSGQLDPSIYTVNGNKISFIQRTTDLTVDIGGAGTDDNLYSTVDINTLPANIENATLLDGGSTVGGVLNGNSLDNKLIGNLGSNSVSGGVGNDIIFGGGGADTLSGGAGVDTMAGGTGNDIYYIDSPSDAVTEKVSEGADLIRTSLTYSLVDTDGKDDFGGNVENLQLTGTGSVNATGNALNNVLYANGGVNIIDGGTGTDTVSFQYATTTGTTGVNLSLATVDSSGYSTASGISGADKVIRIENITGTNYADKLTGNSGNNVLNGLSGNDTLSGGAGNDTYVINVLTDVVTELAGGGTDTIQSSISYSLVDTDGAGTNGSNVEALQLTGTGNTNGTGNTLNNTITGNTGANTLIGNGGNDTLTAGAGADNLNGGTGLDTLVVNTVMGTSSDSSRVVVSGTANDKGQDTLTSFSLTEDTIKVVASNVSNYVHGTDTAIGTAGATDNTGAKTDFTTATGLIDLGHNSNWGNAGDIAVTFVSPTGTWSEATFESRLQYSLTGTTANNTLTGGKLADVFNGGAGNDTLSGGDGNDTLVGGAGTDSLVGGLGNDTFDFNALSELGLATSRDVISGWNAGDKIDLSTIDWNTATAGDQAFSYLGSGAFTTTAGQVRYASGVLQFNTDTDTAAEYEIVITGTPPASFTAGTDLLL